MPTEHEKFEAAIASLEEFCKKVKSEIDSVKPENADESAGVSTEPAYFFQREGMGTIMLSEHGFKEFYDCLLKLHEVVPQGRDVMTLRAVEFALHEAMLKAFFPNQDQPGATYCGGRQRCCGFIFRWQDSSLRNYLEKLAALNSMQRPIRHRNALSPMGLYRAWSHCHMHAFR